MDKSSFELLNFLKEDERKTMYIDRKYTGTEDDYFKELLTSGTIYVGNLSRNTTEAQLHMLFSQCGKIRRISMGLDAKRFVPCGFAFVQYYDVNAPMLARKFFSKYVLDQSTIYIDLDSGFSENRQFGRGANGGQIRSELPGGDRKRRYV
ncbi:nuclear cap-binding protein subunit 2 [Nematocida major]|uniref:nuclear cap-binding protein subunit 2 n=1 Tax=Nematocida major TaxID=1912982 RepID=UPI00200734AA|nr:nuclear cap-binding protein subunit 2 [Nematocida major]KAH9386354.1 nuclear cap-binding protein subunit 2 [Nematocida major]